MTTREKLELIDAFDAAYAGIGMLLAAMPDEAIAFVPPIPDAWSTNDHLVHLLDADLAVCFRLRASVAQPGFHVPVWEEEDWHDRLHYSKEPGRTCFALAQGLRSATCASLRAVAEQDWNEFWVQHPARGKLGLVDLLTMYREHAMTHEKYIKRNKEAWEARRGS